MKKQLNFFWKGALSAYLQFVVVTIVGLWLTPYVLTFLSKVEYGVFAIFIDFITWISFIEITNGVMQSKLVHYYGNNKLYEANVLAVSAFWSQVCIAILILVISIILSNHLELFFNLNGTIPFLKESFILIAISSSINIVGRTYSSIMVASKRIYIDNYINTFIFILRIVLVVIFLNEGYQILSLAISNLVTSIVSVGIKLYRVHKLGFNFSMHPKYISIKKVLFLFDYGKWFTLGSLAGLLIFNIDRLITGKVLGLEMVTIYIVTMKLYELSEKILSKVINISRPFIGELYSKKEYKKLSELFIFMDQIYTFVVIGVGFGILTISSWFIKWWVGEEFYGGDILSFFMFLNFVLQAIVMPKRAYLASTLYEVKKQNIVRLIEGIVNLILSIILVNFLGMIGLIIASILSTMFGSNLTYSYFVRKLFKENKNVLIYNKAFFVSIFTIFLGIICILLIGKLHSYIYIYTYTLIYISITFVYINKNLKNNIYMDLFLEQIKKYTRGAL